MATPHIQKPYAICTLDVGSPRLGNIGWCVLTPNKQEFTGTDINNLVDCLINTLSKYGVLFALEAPLFVPLRQNILAATKARRGEERRPWSAGAGAQVLAMNLPIMTYIFKKLLNCQTVVNFVIKEHDFTASQGQVLVAEALVSGIDKGASHVEDACIMSRFLLPYSLGKSLPNSILGDESEVEYLNLTAAVLVRLGVVDLIPEMASPSPIYKPSQKLL